MKKKCIMAAMIVLAIGMTACSFEPKEGAAISEDTVKPEAAGEETPGTETVKTGTEKTEIVKTETPETNVAADAGKADSATEEIPEGDPIIAMVDRYENNIIVLKDLDDEDIIYYFSTQDAHVVGGDSPIAAGDIVEVTYKGVQGDEEHPGMAVKIVAESMMYK